MSTSTNMSKLPYDMDCTLFTSTFHDIYEHTPSIPKTAHASLKPHHNTAKSLHTLLSRIFISLSHQAKHQILTAYPRLTGATTTTHSSSEQASRGLYFLSADVHTRFQKYNRQYEQTFGWPFIIPVNDFSVNQILEQIVSRLRNEPDEEFTISCACVDRIAEIRLQNWFLKNHPNTCVTNFAQAEPS